MEYLVLFQQNFVLLTSQGFLQFLQIQLSTACWRNFCLYLKDINFYHIINQFIGEFLTFPDSPYLRFRGKTVMRDIKLRTPLKYAVLRRA